MGKTLVIDGDIVAFKAAASAERVYEWDKGRFILTSQLSPAMYHAEERIELLKEKAKVDNVLIAFTGKDNWRKTVWKDYKANRKDTRKPIVYDRLVEELEEQYETITINGLEADDILGIYATKPDSEYIIFSEDKDLKTIYGQHLQYDPFRNEYSVVTVTEDEANAFHLQQTLSGDVTDGYKGCTGIGKDKAYEIVANPFIYVPYEHVFKSGKRKGLSETRYTKEPTDAVWKSILNHYKHFGHEDGDALLNARMANILRHEQFNEETGDIKLWEATMLNNGKQT